jgi:uncharacterized protein YkwD
MRFRRQLLGSFVLGTVWLVASVAARPGEDTLVPHSNRVALRGVTTDLSKLGLREAVERMRAILERAGDAPETLAKLEKSWARNLARKPRGKSPRSVLAKLEQQVALIADMLRETAEPERTELLELVLELDSQEPLANASLGRVLDDGRWATPEEVAWEAGRRRVADLVQEAHRFGLDVETGASDSHVFETLHGEKGAFARAYGVTLHARMSPAKLERVLRQALRATALSNALLTDILAVPSVKGSTTILFMDSQAAYEDALAEARDNGGLSQADYDSNLKDDMRSFADRRGWRTTRWRTEADYQALILWVLIDRTLGHAAQPCLEAGHLNWLSLEFLGASMPIVAWLDSSQPEGGIARTTATKQTPFQAEALWRSARQSLYGCRSWMIHRVLAGHDPPWARSMVDHIGKVTDENLLKSTLIVAFLQETGELPSVLEATREQANRPAAFEQALAVKLPEFEERWQRWLLAAPSTSRGVKQLVASPPPAEVVDPRQAALLSELNRIRHAALEGQWAEFEAVGIDEELSAGALAHARYLDLNEHQKTAWPDAHEEYADREGFTAAGARAGLHGVIAFTDDPAAAVAQWMGTFYHRLPLLDPGMFGVGFAAEGDVAVLDVTSLVLQPWRDHWVMWPHDEMQSVPLAFVPEIPNPIPGENQAEWGYPITLQVFLPFQDLVLDVSLRLFEGAAEGTEVACWFLSPDQPYFPELAPGNAWCLIPRTKLRRGTRYTVVAECVSPAMTLTWSFETN